MSDDDVSATVRVATCIYCAEIYEGPIRISLLKDHVMACPKHPMRAAEAERDESRKYAEEVMAPARELLYLYDWRFDLAKEEKAERAMSPFSSPELNRKLREYGERKKAGWIALRAALANHQPKE